MLGPVKALNRQNYAMVINLVTFYAIVTPLCYWFEFNHGLAMVTPDFDDPADRITSLQGVLLAFVFGFSFQTFAYMTLLG